MSTYTQIIYQIVFRTYESKKTLTRENRIKLYHYINGILRNKNCHVYQINGVEDHIHLLISLHPSVSLASLVKDIKIASSLYIKENRLFEDFTGWQNGYGAFTYSIHEKDRLIKYIQNQEEHHKSKTFKEEYKELLHEQRIEFDEKYLF
jgi:putative transposase